MRQVSFVTALLLLAGCSPSVFSGGIPQATAHASRPVHGVAAPATATRGIYVALGSVNGPTILGFPFDNRSNRAPSCSESKLAPEDVAADRNGNLMAAGGSAGIYVFQGPQMCGPLLSNLSTNGITGDVTSIDAINGPIVAANLYTDGSNVLGAVIVCTLASGGCATTLRNPNVLSVTGVALAENGDCWGSAFGYQGRNATAILVYFKGCAGTGQVATGFKNQSPGGLDVDSRGNLISIDPGQGFWVYHGCNPDCRVRGGLIPAQGGTEYGHLNKDETKFVAADYQYAQIDVYSYRRGRLTYRYSFNNGLSSEAYGNGAAYSPR